MSIMMTDGFKKVLDKVAEKNGVEKEEAHV